MNKTIGLVIGAVLIAGAAFGGGYFAAGKLGSTPGQPGDRGAAFAQLTEAEREQLQNMSDTERQEFFKEKGIEMPSGGPGGQGGQGAPSGQPGGGAPSGGGPGGGTTVLEGTIASVSDDKITVTLSGSGSANAYVDDSTVVAAVAGKDATLAEGATVLVYTEPEAAGVSAAKAIVIK